MERHLVTALQILVHESMIIVVPCIYFISLCYRYVELADVQNLEQRERLLMVAVLLKKPSSLVVRTIP